MNEFNEYKEPHTEFSFFPSSSGNVQPIDESQHDCGKCDVFAFQLARHPGFVPNRNAGFGLNVGFVFELGRNPNLLGSCFSCRTTARASSFHPNAFMVPWGHDCFRAVLTTTNGGTNYGIEARKR